MNYCCSGSLSKWKLQLSPFPGLSDSFNLLLNSMIVGVTTCRHIGIISGVIPVGRRGALSFCFYCIIVQGTLWKAKYLCSLPCVAPLLSN